MQQAVTCRCRKALQLVNFLLVTVLTDATKRHAVKRRQNLVWRFISGVRYSRKNVKLGFGVRFWAVLFPHRSGSPEGCDSMSKGSNFCVNSKPRRQIFSPEGDVIRWYEKKARHVGMCRAENNICLSERSYYTFLDIFVEYYRLKHNLFLQKAIIP